MKHSQTIGAILILALIGACFLPWAYLPNSQTFISGAATGTTKLGRPLTLFSILGGIMLLMFMIRAVWAKRVNFFTGALLLAYAIRCFILFSLCEMGYCPERKAGVFLMLAISVALFVMTLLPKLSVPRTDL